MENKKKFAAYLLKGVDPFKAALDVYCCEEKPENLNLALWAADNWPKDEEVLKFKEELSLSEDENFFLLSKVEFLQQIEFRLKEGLKLQNGNVIPATHEEFAKLAKIYAEVRGFIEKPSTNVNVNNFPKVIEVPVYGSESEWQRAAMTVTDVKH